MLSAFVDESGRRRAGDDCVYALAAVVVSAADLAHCRDSMDQLRYDKSPVVHWRVERPERRRLIAETLTALPIEGVVAVSFYAHTGRPERARRLCLSRLLPELESRGLAEALLESRGVALDQQDRRMLTGLRKSRLVSPRLAVGWERPSGEPMLWAADGVAGAVTWWFGDEPEHLRLLGDKVSLIDAQS